MAQRRLMVNTIKQIIKLKHEGYSNEKISIALAISKGTVNNVIHKFNDSGLPWPLPEEIDNETLINKFYPKNEVIQNNIEPDWDKVTKDLSHPNVTLQLLFEEYERCVENSMSRTSYYRKFSEYSKKSNPSMVITHKAGEKLFIDYSGTKLQYYDTNIKDFRTVEVFVCAWGLSGYTFADVTQTQSQGDFVQSHKRAFAFFGCVPKVWVPDNLKSAVLKPSYYDPKLNPLYGELAQHYGAVIIPTRPYKPKDKAIVENSVLQVQRRIIARLRNQTFLSLETLREAVLALNVELNLRPMKQQGNRSRKERFESFDKPNAKTLPLEDFSITNIQMNLRVRGDYHVQYRKHFYSVPVKFIGTRVDVYEKDNALEIYSAGEHICRHLVNSELLYTTNREHMPNNHRFVHEQAPEILIEKARLIGPMTQEVIRDIMKNASHPEVGARFGSALLRLKKSYSPQRLEAACQRAVYFNAVTYTNIKTILEKNLDRFALSNDEHGTDLNEENASHQNLRGGQYYSTQKTSVGGSQCI